MIHQDLVFGLLMLSVLWAAIDGTTRLGREDGQIVVKKRQLEYTEKAIRRVISWMRTMDQEKSA